jgi:hypothetical protein
MRGRRLRELNIGTGGGSTAKPLRIEKPLLLMFEEDGQTICHIHPTEGYDHRQYGLLICDLVRHMACAFDVTEEEVWEWVDKERRNPTTEITQPS